MLIGDDVWGDWAVFISVGFVRRDAKYVCVFLSNITWWVNGFVAVNGILEQYVVRR